MRHPQREDVSAEYVAQLKEQIKPLTCQLDTAQKRLLPALDQLGQIEAVYSSSPRRQTKLTVDCWTEVCLWSDRDSLDVLQLTSVKLNKIISDSKFLSLRSIQRVAFEEFSYKQKCEDTDDDDDTYDVHLRRGCVELESGKGFRIEVKRMMSAYKRVVPFLRNAFCRELTLCLDTDVDPNSNGYVDAAGLLALLSITQNSARVGLLRVKTDAVKSDLILDVLARLNAVEALQIMFGSDANAVDADFLLACSRRGIVDVRFGVNTAYPFSLVSSKPKVPVEGLVAFCLEGARDGKHRRVAFGFSPYGFVDANALLNRLVEESRKLATVVPFSFKISPLEQMDLQLYQSYLHGDVLLINDLENGLSMTVAVTEHDTAPKRGKKRYDLDVSVKQRR